MKRVASLLLAVVFVLLLFVVFVSGLTGVTMALPDEDNFGGEGEGFNQTGENHFTHKDGDVRFNWREGDPAFVVPGYGGAKSNPNSAIWPHGDASIVRPLR